jgi:hypothetical protein
VKTGCARQRVASATPNCSSSPSAGAQSRAVQPARPARTLDGEPARRLINVTFGHSNLTNSNRGLNCRVRASSGFYT